MQNSKLLVMKGISKHFPGVLALSDVDFDLEAGEVHVLLGENGAGKSTLIKILSGVYQKDAGEIVINGQKVEITDPHHAQELGISTIYQELNLIPQLDVARNVFLGREPMLVPALKWIDYRTMYAQTKRLLDELEVDISPRATVRNLGVAQRQMVELAKALSFQSRIMIMDEPTAALTDQEIGELFKTIRSLQDRGVGIIYISHRLQELSRVGRRATVLRDGNVVGSVGLAELSAEDPEQARAHMDRIITMMVGRNLEQKFPKVTVEKGKEALRIENLSQAGVLRDVNLVAHHGEITGIAGLMGAGRTELAHAVFGITKIDSGQIYVDGKPISVTSPRQAIDHGIAYLPEDRKTHGVLLLMSVSDNIIMAGVDHLSTGLVISQSRKRRVVGDAVKTLRIRTPSVNQQVQYLSGGNQQKVVLAKWLISQARIFFFDEPTRGVDVGAKVEVYQLMNELLKQGAAIIMISSELPEILAMSDRVLVMREGTLVKEFSRAEATEERIMAYATGGVQDAA